MTKSVVVYFRDSFYFVISLFPADEAVLSGSLVWKRMDPPFPRTLAEFTLSLTLSSSFYFNKSEGDTIEMPGVLMFGDETLAEEVKLTVRMTLF